MSNEAKRKETAQEREARRQNEIAALMESMERTAPPADTELLNSLKVGLIESPEKAFAVKPAAEIYLSEAPAIPIPVAPPAPPGVPIEGALRLPPLSSAPTIGKPTNETGDFHSVLSEAHIPADLEQFTVEATITEIARAAKAYAYPDVTGRGSVRVSEDVFSRVTMVYAKARIDKILVLSYLLYCHVPAEGVQRVPKWVLDPPPKMPRPRILVFIKDEGMARRLSDTAIRFGITEADIVENVVRKHIPEAPFQYKPKRRMRFTA